MMDYKELIDRLKGSKLPSSKEAARVIETLLAERDAAVAELNRIAEFTEKEDEED